MDIKTVIVTLLSIVVVNNFVISKATGLPNAMVRNSKKFASFCKYSFLVVCLTAFTAYLLNGVLASLNVAYLGAFLVAVVGLAYAAVLKNVCKADDAQFVMAAFNSAVVALAANVMACETVLVAFYTSSLAALGYVLAAYVYAGVVSRIDNKAVVPAFRGLPIEMVALGIVALAALAFK